MSTFRALNNAKAFTTVPQSVTSTGDVSGQVKVYFEEFPMSTVVANGDVVLCQIIPANERVLSVTVVNNENVADGVINVGYSASNEAGLIDNGTPIVADPDAFLTGTNTLAAATAQHAMPTEGVAGYLLALAKPVYLTVTFTTAPTVKGPLKLKVLLQTIGK
jgi:fructose-specific component phosphotransferase system IIB-like protein